MLTTRGWWLLLVALLLTVLGVFARLPGLVPVGLTLLLWLAGVGALFYVRARFVTPRLELVRTVSDERGVVDTLWAGRPFEVRVELRAPGRLELPYAAVSDQVPFTVEFLSGTVEACGPLGRQRPLVVCYRVRAPAPGRARFEGVRVRLADLQGLFYHDTFLRAPAEYRVLPVLVDESGHPATTKRYNLLPPPGIHRMRRPGSGSELLDLRDYRPGDPPKTIAWKVSARRDRLITKEFESEVPLRCTLFVDRSNSVRVGPAGKNALARLTEIASAVAQANTAVRDLTGLCLFDERAVTVVRPARTGRHLARLLNLLADAAGLAPSTGRVRAHVLLPLAYAFAKEVYPQLLRNEVNHVPFWLPWLAPPRAYTVRRPTAGDRLYGWLPAWAALLLLATTASAVTLAAAVGWFGTVVLEESLAALTAAVAGGGLVAGLGLLLTRRLLWPRRRRQHAWWKQLAALLAVRYGLAPGGLAVLMEDEELLSVYLQRFLAEHQVPYALPYYDREGRYLFAAPQKVEVLARALLQAVGKGHDNELFVLLADLLELSDRLGPLLRAVRVARARHHQVVVVCPWPPGLAPPSPGTATAESPEPSRPGWLERTVVQTTEARFHRAYQALRQKFARMGVTVVCAASDEPVRLVLDRMERLRLQGCKR